MEDHRTVSPSLLANSVTIGDPSLEGFDGPDKGTDAKRQLYERVIPLYLLGGGRFISPMTPMRL